MKFHLRKLKGGFISNNNHNALDAVNFTTDLILVRGYTKVKKEVINDTEYIFFIHPEDYNYFLNHYEEFLLLATKLSIDDLPEIFRNNYAIEYDDLGFINKYFDAVLR